MSEEDDGDEEEGDDHALDTEADTYTSSKTSRQKDIQTKRQTNAQTETHTDRQKDGHRDRQAKMHWMLFVRRIAPCTKCGMERSKGKYVEWEYHLPHNLDNQISCPADQPDK